MTLRGLYAGWQLTIMERADRRRRCGRAYGGTLTLMDILEGFIGR